MTDQKMNNSELTFAAAAFAVFLCILFGSNSVAIKLSFLGMGTFTAAGIRFGVASLALLIWGIATKESFRLKNKRSVVDIVIMTVIFVVQLALFYLGLSKTTASRGILIANLMPFFVLFLAHYFIPGDRMSIKKLVGIIVGFAGVAFIFFDKNEISAELLKGDRIVFLAIILWAVNAVYIKRVIDQFNPFQITFYPMIFSAPVFLILGFYFDNGMIRNLDMVVVLSMLYQSLVTAAFGFIAWNILLQKYGAVSLHSFVFIMPIAGVALGGWLLKETITTNIITALVLIVTGILIVNLWKTDTTERYISS